MRLRFNLLLGMIVERELFWVVNFMNEFDMLCDSLF